MRWIVLAPLLFVAACATGRPGTSASCPLPDQKPVLQIEMFFGRSIAGGATVSDAEWQAFSNTVLSKEFPEGSTTLPAQGQWLDPQSGETIHEPSLLVLIDVDPGSDFPDKVARVVDAYEKQFHQESVGVVTEAVCARF